MARGNEITLSSRVCHVASQADVNRCRARSGPFTSNQNLGAPRQARSTPSHSRSEPGRTQSLCPLARTAGTDAHESLFAAVSRPKVVLVITEALEALALPVPTQPHRACTHRLCICTRRVCRHGLCRSRVAWPPQTLIAKAHRVVQVCSLGTVSRALWTPAQASDPPGELAMHRLRSCSSLAGSRVSLPFAICRTQDAGRDRTLALQPASCSLRKGDLLPCLSCVTSLYPLPP